ncbi:MAG: hypothetical protein H6633_31445 [Anaerolineales bacterium]|nr:hypothetical protein [Anaerolineales bacterium]
MRRIAYSLGLVLVGVGLMVIAGFMLLPSVAAQTPTESELPLPSTLPLDEYEQQLFQFLESKRYQELGWVRDKRVRDTGPFIDGVSYGTHPAVRIYYSPEVYSWLQNGREGELPDGAMIIQ